MSNPFLNTHLTQVEELQSEVESLRSAVSANQKATSVISPAVERPSSSENPTSVPTANIRPLPSPHGGAFHHAGPTSSRAVAASSRQSATTIVMGQRHHPNRTGDRCVCVCIRRCGAWFRSGRCVVFLFPCGFVSWWFRFVAWPWRFRFVSWWFCCAAVFFAIDVTCHTFAYPCVPMCS